MDAPQADLAGHVALVTGANHGIGAVAVEADLADPAAPVRLLDAAEAAFGPVAILVANASAWQADSFAPVPADRMGRDLPPVSAATATGQLLVDARGHAC